ncbi:MAG: hypothetical protein U9R79_04160 [Armatimonadota bacterium]|nr:hypothetical protein [Armatimonadota bacterium]
MRRLSAIMALLACTAGAWAAPEDMVPRWEYVPTQVPFTHILDYGDIFSPEYLAGLEEGPPHLITHHELTVSHPYFGPMCDLGAIRAGEEEASAEEAVAAYRAHREQVKAYIEAAHARGVEVVTSYICMMTTGGHPDRRLGIWRFWDNWEAFEQFDLPAKPEDPITWQQRKPDGSEHHFYRKEHEPYAPMYRYSNCVNNPNFHAYQRWVVEEAARAGLDGVFVDNAGSQRCYCAWCRDGFDQWLRERYEPEEIEALFDGDTRMAEDLTGSDLRAAETQLFWQESIHRHLERIRRWGTEIHGSFYIYPNGLHRRAHAMATRFRDADLGMAENSSGAFGGHPGIARRHVVAGLYMRHVNQNLRPFRYAPAIGASCRVSMMSYSGYPNTDEANLGPNENVGVLGLAEAAAFGGGGTYLMYRPARHPWMAPVRAMMNGFFERNADLYAGRYPWGQVAVFTPVLPNYFRDGATHQLGGEVLEMLMGRGLLVDLMTEQTFSSEALDRYEAVVAPGVRIMSDMQMRALIDYAADGGQLILIGEDTAARDRLGRERADADRQPLLSAADAVLTGSIDELGGAVGLPDPVRGADSGHLVRLAAYVDSWDGPTDLTVHCVNYDVEIGTAHDGVGAVDDLALSIPLPPGMTARAATLKVPGRQDVSIDVEMQGGRAEVVIPHLEIYALLHIT